MPSSEIDRPAILGGLPVRPQGPPSWPRVSDEVQQVLKDMVESGEWGRYHGPHVPALCERIADYHSIEHVLLCSSGTSAIELALRGVNVRDDDEIIVAAYDFKANFQNVLQLKAVPVLVDLRPDSWHLDPACLEKALTNRTKAVLVSHLHGGVVDMPRVRQFADAHQIALIEDACQNPGAILFGRRAGTWGDVGVLSFGGSKLLTAGRGGAILTSQSVVVERIKRHVMRGNDAYPLSEIQAALLLPQLNSLDDLNGKRRQSISHLSTLLHDLEWLIPLQLPTADVQPAYYKVGFQYKGIELPRDVFVEALRAEGIAIDAGFRANHLIHGSRRFRAVDSLTEATNADSRMITLHHPVLLEDSSAIEQIGLAIRKVLRHSGEIAARKR